MGGVSLVYIEYSSRSLQPENQLDNVLPTALRSSQAAFAIVRILIVRVFCSGLILTPYHLIHYSHIGLDDFHDLSRHILFHVVRNRNAVVAVSVHGHSCINRL